MLIPDNMEESYSLSRWGFAEDLKWKGASFRRCDLRFFTPQRRGSA